MKRTPREGRARKQNRIRPGRSAARRKLRPDLGVIDRTRPEHRDGPVIVRTSDLPEEELRR